MSVYLNSILSKLSSDELYLLNNWKTEPVLLGVLKNINLLHDPLNDCQTFNYNKFGQALLTVSKTIDAETEPERKIELIKAARNHFGFVWRQQKAEDGLEYVIFEEDGFPLITYKVAKETIKAVYAT